MFTNQITSMGSMFTNLATSKLMPGFMSQGVMDFGTGIQAAGQGLSGLSGAFGSGNLSHMAGAAAGGLMAGMQGYGISKALSGGYSTGGNTVNLLAGIGSAFFGPIAGVIGGAINRAFGMKAKETKAAGFSGTFSTEGADIKQFTDWFQKGGWFRSNKSGTEFSAVDAETAKAFSDTVKDTTKTVESLGKVLGFDPTKTKGFSKAVKIDLKGLNEKQQQEAIQKAFKDYGASLVGSSFQMVGKFKRGGEDQLDTLSRLAGASETFKSVMTGPDVKKILGLDTADTIKNLVSKQFSGITNVDAAIKDYLAGGVGRMDTAGTAGLMGSFSSADIANATRNVFEKMGITPIGDLAEDIISAFTTSLKDGAGNLKEFLSTYIADFQSQLIDAYGGQEQFQKVESSLFDLLYTEEEKKQKMQELTAQQMKDAAKELKDAGVAIDPDKLATSFEDNRKAAQTMLKTADADLASGKITKEQYATIRKSAADFLTAAKKNSELGPAVATAATTFDATKYMFPRAAGEAANTITASVIAGTASIAAAATTGSGVIASSSVAGANAIASGASSQVSTLDQLITNFVNSSSTFSNAVAGLSGTIGSLDGTIANFEWGGGGGGEGGVGAAAGDDGSASDGGAGGGADGSGSGDGSGGVGGGGVGVGGGDGSGGGGAGDGSAWAAGGVFRPNRPMIVGEVGPEIVLPNYGGSVVSTKTIMKAIGSARSSFDNSTRNVIEQIVQGTSPASIVINAMPSSNPVTGAYMAQENEKKYLDYERNQVSAVNNAMVDNSVTQVSSPSTTVINAGGDVRSTHPISGMFTRGMIGARGFGS
jgi:hypothetical protein